MLFSALIDDFQIGVAQLNPTVGSLQGNCDLIYDAACLLDLEHADLAVFSELCVTGYPPEDLVRRPAFLQAVRHAVQALASDTAHLEIGLLISAPWAQDDECGQSCVYNAALLVHKGAIVAVRYKHDLPNYGVFDEKRVFTPGPLPDVVRFKGKCLGVMTCEDMWSADVARHLAGQGAEVFLVSNASPFATHKHEERLFHAQARASDAGIPLVYVNQVGGQDEVVFDGRSFALDAHGLRVAQLPAFRGCVACQGLALPYEGAQQGSDLKGPDDGLALLYEALVVALRDYVQKNGFSGVLLGLSGGVDSALSAAIAVDALGPQRVQCVMMPSRYTSVESREDAQDLAHNLAISLDVTPIDDIVTSFEAVLPEDAPCVMFENVQSRARGVILMALSNANGKMVLSTGNKSEMAVGYATIYGDMCGGYNLLKDVYKGQVYALCVWRNGQAFDEGYAGGGFIPERILTKAPSAELREDQTDQDSLPPYDVLDDILTCLIELELPIEEIAAQKPYKLSDIIRVERLLIGAEYKRRQAPPGVKVSRRAFGKERRYPITNRFIEIE